MKIYSYKHGDVMVERLFPSGLYHVQLRDRSGNVKDRIRCDDYRTAMEYKRAFIAIAKHNS